MMQARILQVLEQNGVEFVEYGESHNVARGNVNVQCPWCGHDDKSHHMGINLETGYYGCWRDPSHRGKKSARLFAKLLGCSYGHAAELLGHRQLEQSEFDAVASGRVFEKEEWSESCSDPMTEKEMVEGYSLRPIKKTVATTRFFSYLAKRGFSNAGDAAKVVKRYGLYCAIDGKFANRLVIPVWWNGRVISITSRSIFKNDPLRYLSLGNDESPMPIKETVYNADTVQQFGGRLLCVHEGPLDALKTDYYGQRHGVRAVALYNMELSVAQAATLHTLAEKFDEVWFCFDKGCEIKAQKAAADSMLRNSRTLCSYPHGAKDAGELGPDEVAKFCRRLLHGKNQKAQA